MLKIINFKTIFLIIIPIAFLSISDFKHVIYDSETDYLGSAFNIYFNNESISKFHPGTLTQYLLSFSLFFSLNLGFSVETTIFISRIFLHLISVVLLFLSFKNLRVNNYQFLSFFYFYFFLIIIFPSTNILFRQISAEILLVPTSILFLSFINKENFNYKHLVLSSILAGTCLNLKFSFIFILIIVLLNKITASYFSNNFFYNIKASILIFFFSLLLFCLSFFFFYQELPTDFYKIVLNIIVNYKSKVLDIYLVSISIKYWPILLIITLILVFIVQKIYFLNKKFQFNLFNLMKIFFTNYFLFLLSFFALIFYFLGETNINNQFVKNISVFENIGIIHRSKILFFIIMLFYFLKYFLLIKKPLVQKKQFFSYLLILFFFIFFMKITYERKIIYNNDLTITDSTILKIKNKNKDNKIILEFDNNFNSITSFANWTDIKYGNCNNRLLKDSFYKNYPKLLFDEIYYLGRNKSRIPPIGSGIYDDLSIIYCNSENIFSSNICEFLDNNNNQIYYLHFFKHQKKEIKSKIQNSLKKKVYNCKKKIKLEENLSNKVIDVFEII